MMADLRQHLRFALRNVFRQRARSAGTLAAIALGVAGVLPPATSALLHNGSTLGISLRNMTDLLDDEENPPK